MAVRRTKAEEASVAEYYEQHKDDADEWGDIIETPPDAASRIGSAVTVRFPAKEAARLRQLAQETGQSNSEIIRQAVKAFGVKQDIHK